MEWDEERAIRDVRAAYPDLAKLLDQLGEALQTGLNAMVRQWDEVYAPCMAALERWTAEYAPELQKAIREGRILALPRGWEQLVRLPRPDHGARHARTEDREQDHA